jgi:carboxyl-terminal processing protease
VPPGSPPPLLSRLRAIVLAVVLVLAAFLVGVVAGGHPGTLPSWIKGPFVDEDARVVAEALDHVHDTYYRKIGRGSLADTAIAGMVGSLDDRFSNYFTPAEYKRFRQQQTGEFSGVGMTVQGDKRGLRVVQVYDNSPAHDAGIRIGDVIVAVNGRSLRGVRQDQAVARIKGPRGTDVRLTFLHRAKRITRTLTRATVSVSVVASRNVRVRGRKVGVVSLADFSEQAHGQVDTALHELLRRGADGLILDLRRNGGGLVSEAQLVASAFLRDGAIVTTKGRDVASRTLRAIGDPIAPTQPLVVLVDRDTASAAEIVTGALQDRHRATVVGTRTFGKGVFQEVIELSNGGALDITAGQYFLPSGRNLGGRGVQTGSGIAPNVRGVDDPKTPRDEALHEALLVVRKKLQ